MGTHEVRVILLCVPFVIAHCRARWKQEDGVACPRLQRHQRWISRWQQACHAGVHDSSYRSFFIQGSHEDGK